MATISSFLQSGCPRPSSQRYVLKNLLHVIIDCVCLRKSASSLREVIIIFEVFKVHVPKSAIYMLARPTVPTWRILAIRTSTGNHRTPNASKALIIDIFPSDHDDQSARILPLMDLSPIDSTWSNPTPNTTSFPKVLSVIGSCASLWRYNSWFVL